MKAGNIYIYILVMAVVTYLIRMLPMILVKKEITNVTIRSFLYYVPYVTLSLMTFPAILSATNTIASAAVAFIIAVIAAYKGSSLIKVTVLACLTVFILEMFL